MSQNAELSVVIPVFNEDESVTKLAKEIDASLQGRAYEMLFIDDCSQDNTRLTLQKLKDKFHTMRIILHRKNAGQSRAIRTGIYHAKAPIVAIIDGDGQNDPADIPHLYRQLTRADADEKLAMVMGKRLTRKDNLWKRLGSRLANHIRKALLNDDCDDSGCGIKIIHRDIFMSLPFFDHMHRYMPALIGADGFKTEFVTVNHRERKTGQSKYTNIGRLFAALWDLVGVIWLIRRRRDYGGVDEL